MTIKKEKILIICHLFPFLKCYICIGNVKGLKEKRGVSNGERILLSDSKLYNLWDSKENRK